WEDILPEVQNLLGSTEDMADTFTTASTASNDHFGEINVFIQMLRNIPIQVKLQDVETEERFGLPEHFTNAVMEASEASDNMLMERKLIDQNPSYCDMKEIDNDVVEELTASYDQERLADLVELAFTTVADISAPST